MRRPQLGGRQLQLLLVQRESGMPHVKLDATGFGASAACTALGGCNFAGEAGELPVGGTGRRDGFPMALAPGPGSAQPSGTAHRRGDGRLGVLSWFAENRTSRLDSFVLAQNQVGELITLCFPSRDKEPQAKPGWNVVNNG